MSFESSLLHLAFWKLKYDISMYLKVAKRKSLDDHHLPMQLYYAANPEI